MNGKLGFLLIPTLCVAVCGCSLFEHYDDIASAAADDQAVYVEDGEPRIVSGLRIAIAVTASGASAIQSGVYEVDALGCIMLPLVGSIKCEGLTLVELQAKIQEAFKAYYLEPQATCNFVYAANSGMKSPWGSVLMMGEVRRPGPVNMTSTRDLTVTRALLLAGNPTQYADQSRVRVTRREKDGSLKRFKVDVEKIGEKGALDQDLKLRPGDVVWVPESWY